METPQTKEIKMFAFEYELQEGKPRNFSAQVIAAFRAIRFMLFG